MVLSKIKLDGIASFVLIKSFVETERNVIGALCMDLHIYITEILFLNWPSPSQRPFPSLKSS